MRIHVPVSITLTEHQHEELKALATACRLRLDRVIQEIVESWIADRRGKARDAARV